MKYTLVYGLSANPVYQAHIELVSDAAKALIVRGYAIVKILIIPVYRRNPVGAESERKRDLPPNFEHRFVMCKLAAKEIAQRLEGQGGPVEVSRIEEELAKPRQGPNYTVETLSALQAREASGTDLIFLLGSDLVSGDDPEFGHWYRPDKLVQLAIIAICPRPGYQPNKSFLKSFEQKGAHFVYLNEVAARDIAARKIKERLEAGEEPLVLGEEGLLPMSVARYVREHNFYRPNCPS
jgi:nicotinate (nicotinamide) nucleotide adenylyltransferase